MAPRLCRERRGGGMSIKPELLEILKHSIGTPGRNYFATDPWGEDGKRCIELCGLGYMEDRGAQAIWGGMHGYSVTEAGRALVESQLSAEPEPKKMSRGQIRYQDFLSADSGMSFIEWIKARQQYD